MKKLLLPIVALTVLFGCKKDPVISNGAADSSPVTYTGKSDINSALILPEAMEYYKNIVDVVQWYASHPTNKRAGSGLDGDTVNALMTKISEISILDSNLVEKTIFDLEENERAEFLETWALIEANDLSEKLKMDTTQNATSIIADRNESFKQAFGTSNKSLDSEQEDPYWKVRRIMDLKEKQRLSDMPISSGFQKTTDADDTFWAKVISNGLLSFSIIQIAPNSLTPQTFVDRIRPSIKPGRLLIANPGYGNPLLLRKPLNMGVPVIMAHCASLGQNSDLDDVTKKPVDNFDLFIRMMDEEKYKGLLYGDISAMCQYNRIGKPLLTVLRRKELHARLLNGSDYPLPAINALIRTKDLAKEGYITETERKYLNEIYKYNPLLFDFVLKRTLKDPLNHTNKLSVTIFIKNPQLGY